MNGTTSVKQSRITGSDSAQLPLVVRPKTQYKRNSAFHLGPRAPNVTDGKQQQ